MCPLLRCACLHDFVVCEGGVKLKDMTARNEEFVPLDGIVAALQAKGCRTVHNEAKLL